MKLIPIEVLSDINERPTWLRQERVVCFHQRFKESNRLYIGEGEKLVSCPNVLCEKIIS